MDPMLGMIYIVPFNWAPSGYLICQGQVIGLSQYQALFSLIGTTYGGNGVSTFGLPNLQGRVPLGYGAAQGGTNYPLGTTVGTETTTLTTINMPTHTHAANFTATTGTQSVTIPATTGNLQVGVTVNATSTAAASGAPSSASNMLATASGTNKIYGATTTSNLVPLGGTSAAVTGNPDIPASTVNIQTVTGGTVTVGTAGNSQPFNTLQPSLALNFIIAMNGIYPSRP